jgi:DNA mismatch repair protein MutS2
MQEFPDLLSSEPTRRLDPRKTSEALTFAFAQGVGDDTWAALLASATLPATRWDPETFARDLFVTDLVAGSRTITIDGVRHQLGQKWLERVLSHPPREVSSVELRREVLRELAGSKEMRADLESLYASVRKLRSQLGIAPICHTEVLRRRLDILATVRGLIESGAGAFSGASSVLSRIPRWALALRETDAHKALVELLDYDDNLATVDVRVRVGADGRVRGMSLARVNESPSRFARTPLGRWIARLILVFRGYRFDAEELMARAIEEVFEGLREALVALVQLAGDMEVYLAALAFRDNAERAGLAVCLPEIGREGERRLLGLFNPLLLPHEKRVVPCDVEMRADRVALVTGPNSGGKTRLLQAIGIAQLLGQGGLFVPAREARIVTTDGVFASFGQAPAADASEGRLGTELLRVRALFESMCVGGMVLVDELCSGTNPSEGEELFRTVVALLGELDPQAFLSTHFLTLAADLERSPPDERLSFLQVELDPKGLPTYQFVPGVAKTSLAFQTAARLGVTRDDLAALVEKAKRAR